MAIVPVTLPSFYSMVLNYEGLQQAQQAEGDEWTSSANATSRPGHTNPGRPSGGAPGGYQQQPNYQQQDRRPSGGSTGNYQQKDRRRDGGGQDQRRDGDGNGRNGGGNDSRRWRPKCQICKNWGHEASDCRTRYDDYPSSGNTASTSSNNPPH
jgi:hypothetical protein